MYKPDTALFSSEPFSENALVHRLKAHIADSAFPCVGAKAALARGGIEVVIARSITSAWDDIAVHRRLIEFVRDYQQDRALFRSFAVVFAEDEGLSETDFEHSLWERVQSLSDKDVWLGQDYDPRVSPDPDNPHFALSFAGEAFFLVGLHPKASRESRRFEHPVIVFNLRDQFEKLRADGRYEKMRATIIERDVALQGNANPMLARHGETSEARQYSGRAVEGDWQCPFNYAAASNDGD